MRLLAGLFAGTFAYLALGTIVGVNPAWLIRERTGRRKGARAQDWLNQAGAEVTPFQFVIASIGGSAIAAFFIWAITGVAALAFVASGLALAAPRMFYSRRRATVIAERLEAWPDVIRDLAIHLRSSMSVHASLCEIGRSGPVPLRPFFNRYAGLSATLDHRSSLEVVREELADSLSDRIIEVILVAFEQGTSVVMDILDDLGESTAADLRLIETIRTSQLETKLESRGAAVLPFVVLALLCTSTTGYREFYSTPAGWVVVMFGGLMAIGGMLAINTLGTVPSEHRILAGAKS